MFLKYVLQFALLRKTVDRVLLGTKHHQKFMFSSSTWIGLCASSKLFLVLVSKRLDSQMKQRLSAGIISAFSALFDFRSSSQFRWQLRGSSCAKFHITA